MSWTDRHRIPRYFTPRPKPWRPLFEALDAYGVTDYVPETATVTHDRNGLTIDVFVPDTDGLPMVDEDTFEPITRRRFYPDPARPGAGMICKGCRNGQHPHAMNPGGTDAGCPILTLWGAEDSRCRCTIQLPPMPAPGPPHCPTCTCQETP